MGKGTDKLYITHSEWSSSDAFSASVGAGAGAKAQRAGVSFRKLPFNFCSASLQPFENPVCTADGTIFDAEVIAAWLAKRKTNPVNGEPLSSKDLIKLNFARNADTSEATGGGGDAGGGIDGSKGDLIDPVSYKVFTDNTHIVALRHGSYANVFAWDTVQRMNIRTKNWRDLVDDEEFSRADIITLQDPQHAETRDLSQFKYLKDGEAALPGAAQARREDEGEGDVNIDALGRIGDKVLRAKVAVERARQDREAGGDVNRSLSSKSGALTKSGAKPVGSMIQEKKKAYNAAAYTTGRAAASFTSTGLTPETSGERATLSDEEYLLFPRRVKQKGYARIETNLGELNIELQTEYAPRAVWNFIRLAQKGYYKNVAFHRNIAGFMIQGGDPSGTGKGGTSIWGKNFKDEIDGPLVHGARGIVSMANKGKDTNSSQFFVTYKPVPHLDRKHTVFARVVSGMEVLKKMEEMPTDGSNRPLNKIVMREVVVYVDPFEGFMKEKGEHDTAEALKARKKAEGGDDDDKTTWTGKRIRPGAGAGGSEGGVGKYLKQATRTDSGGQIDTWDDQQQPAKKKFKAGGFGNFDGW
ncbi:peptidyl-prolyl cis-trans isomerase-like 2 [Zalerion maritima]|uniref:Peptidyl-prolyl cis-trans isomerase-like 2 n=1 Tax=Zalerion maritima TaxID=339359 RepID=A0AAD5WNU3_9PEZI|nr:peptidyl-prolyl cis-trans isomerase-like 2 [Zalerion maritima]